MSTNTNAATAVEELETTETAEAVDQQIDVPEMAECFAVTNDAEADWAVRKIAEHRAEVARWAEHFKVQLDRITATEEASIAYLTRLLSDYFPTVPHKSTKTEESYRLPSGKIYMKQQQPKFERDEETLTSWAKENRPELVKTVTTESTDWNTLKKSTTVLESGEVADALTGEIIPGVRAEFRPAEFKIDC